MNVVYKGYVMKIVNESGKISDTVQMHILLLAFVGLKFLHANMVLYDCIIPYCTV